MKGVALSDAQHATVAISDVQNTTWDFTEQVGIEEEDSRLRALTPNWKDRGWKKCSILQLSLFVHLI